MKTFVVILLSFISIKINAQMVNSVYFKNNSYELSQESKTKLDSVAQLKSNLTFRIFGNCDPSGNIELNRKLSENRADAVYVYLKNRIGNNIKLKSSVGLGIEKQINDNSTEDLRTKNRRVDVLIDKTFAPGEKISRKVYPNFLSTKISMMKVKDTFSLPDVSFFGGRHAWLPGGQLNLTRLSNILKENPTLQVELQGHICCDYDNFDGEDLDLKTFNLSWTRANAIKEFLAKQGIDINRIKATGMGHLNPVIYPEITEADRIKNRRVELVLIKK
ncbi:OmpA family protein [Chryseobacterium chendengshani]|uniref:OmpA family protein n=1 Tax=Chryseobacterium sp. LJ668 TaxID=2864040 RepID=UPI001C68F5FD|nr:OmpA family protein [Chryseobacterium sp. LJ668]MBW8523061.1 OmpA family protein [Chryseobacterium sp. LJ668]QYK16588.1 OmpA family protein [Chryseobacterium sp. LJ668]